MSFRMAIVGGGIHGAFLYATLTQRLGWSPRDIAVIDPHEAPLARWDQCAAQVQMASLRSTRGHHLGWRSRELWHFAKERGYGPGHFGDPPYFQPSVEVFRAHAAHVIEASGLRSSWHQGRVEGLEWSGDKVALWGGGQRWEAAHVALALGSTGAPRWPRWARELKARGAPISHVFEAGFSPRAGPDDPLQLVIGGGMSAGQLALALCAKRPSRVALLTRHPLRCAWFDADPGWVGPREMRAFWAEPSLQKRRQMLDRARLPGTLSPPVFEALQEAIESRRLLHWQLPCYSISMDAQGALWLDDGEGAGPGDEGPVQLHELLLATGAQAGMPRWLEALELPRGPRGAPAVDRSLRWHPRLFVMGGLAELELGPTAPNIVGARMAAARIAEALEAGLSSSLLELSREAIVLFVYGSLRSGAKYHHWMHQARFKAIAHTRPEYALLDLGPYPAMVPGDGVVVGELYAVSPGLLKQLDHFEGHPHEYLRSAITLADGTRAFTYIWQASGGRAFPQIPGGDWLNVSKHSDVV